MVLPDVSKYHVLLVLNVLVIVRQFEGTAGITHLAMRHPILEDRYCQDGCAPVLPTNRSKENSAFYFSTELQNYIQAWRYKPTHY